jgi:hypothetical protein
VLDAAVDARKPAHLKYVSHRGLHTHVVIDHQNHRL